MTGAGRRGGLLLVALGASLWGTDTVLRRPLAGALSSLEVVFYEHLLLAILLLPVLVLTHAQWRRLSWREWAALLWIGWGGSALGSFCFTEAIRVGNPSTVVLLQKSQPVFVMLLAAVVLGEMIPRRRWLSLGVAMLAVYAVSFGGSGLRGMLAPGVGGSGQALPAALALVAALLWAGSTVLGRYVAPGLSFAALTTLRIVVALPLLAVLKVFRGESHFADIHLTQFLSLLWLAVVPGLIALLLYYRGLQHTLASQAGIAELCFPATATLLNWLFLGSRLTGVQLGGFFLLWAVIAEMQRDRAEAAVSGSTQSA